MRFARLFVFAIVFCFSVGVSAFDLSVEKRCSSEVENCFSTLTEALETVKLIRSSHSTLAVIYVGEGVFFEKLRVDEPNIRIVGQGVSRTILRFDAYAGISGKYHRDNWGTPGSATLTINATNVTVTNLTVENSFDYLANDSLSSQDEKKIRHSQAVALLLDVDSDKVLLEQVELLAYQDTLFANGGRAYIRNSKITGNVDFIFGNGVLLIEESDIVSRPRAAQMAEGSIHSYITAGSTPLSQPYGITIANSRLLKEEGVPIYSVSLGRPWHPTTNFPDGRYADPNAVAQVNYINCFMDDHIHPEAWRTMSGTARDGSKSLVFGPKDSRFFEQGSRGPGAQREFQQIDWQEKPNLASIREYVFKGWVLP